MSRNYDRVNKFVDTMVEIANDDSHGYAQDSRWPEEGDDFDCASLTYWAAYKAGYNVTIGPGGVHYTGTIIPDFTAAGFRCDVFDGNLGDLEKGDILLNEQNHVAVYIGDGQLAEASMNSFGGIVGDTPGDQTGWEIHICNVYNYPWTHVLTPPADYDDASDGRLCGIDISSWQEGIVPSETDADFVIIKATGGTSYKNPFWREWADNVLASGKLLGLYHYAMEYGSYNSAQAEAEYFLAEVSDYIGKAVLILDWENDALSLPVSWAREWLDTIAERTGATPWFYGYASNVNSTDYSSIAQYPLWMASYLDRYIGSGFIDDPDQIWDTGAWDELTAYQYASQGRISGWGGDIDLSVFYGSAADWAAMAGGNPQPKPDPQPDPKPVGDNIRYRASTDPSGREWLPDMIGRYDTGGSSDTFAGELGEPLRWIAIQGVGKYRVCTQASGWLPWVKKFDPADLENGCAGDGSPIIALEIPSADVRYALHDLGGGWNADMVGNRDTGGSSDTFAGSMRAADAVRVEWA